MQDFSPVAKSLAIEKNIPIIILNVVNFNFTHTTYYSSSINEYIDFLRSHRDKSGNIIKYNGLIIGNTDLNLYDLSILDRMQNLNEIFTKNDIQMISYIMNYFEIIHSLRDSRDSTYSHLKRLPIKC